VLCSNNDLPAQQSLLYAAISGRVTDATGAAISGATITALESQTLTSQSVISDGNGSFRFAHLPNGQYEITVHQVNYKDTIKTVTCTPETPSMGQFRWRRQTRFKNSVKSPFINRQRNSPAWGFCTETSMVVREQLANWNAVQAPVSLPLTEYGAALGGRANRTAYFLTLDRQRLGLPADASLVKALGGRVESPAEGAFFPEPATSSQSLARLDHRFQRT